MEKVLYKAVWDCKEYANKILFSLNNYKAEMESK